MPWTRSSKTSSIDSKSCKVEKSSQFLLRLFYFGWFCFPDVSLLFLWSLIPWFCFFSLASYQDGIVTVYQSKPKQSGNSKEGISERSHLWRSERLPERKLLNLSLLRSLSSRSLQSWLIGVRRALIEPLVSEANKKMSFSSWPSFSSLDFTELASFSPFLFLTWHIQRSILWNETTQDLWRDG